MRDLTLDQFADDSVPSRYAEDLARYKKAFKSEKGLVPAAAMREILGVSRQRVWQLEKQNLWKTYNFFGEKFYSRIQMEEFANTVRPSHRPSMSKVVQDCLSDVK
jgi:hypothetical protein